MAEGQFKDCMSCDNFSDSLLKELTTTVAIQGEAIRKMEVSMSQVSDAISKLAVLEEHRQNYKVVEIDIYKKLNKAVQDLAVLKSHDERFVWLERVVYGSIVGGLISAVLVLLFSK